MKAASLLILALTLSACAGGPAVRHASVVEEHPDFPTCVTLVQASWNAEGGSRAQRLESCLDRPQVALAEF